MPETLRAVWPGDPGGMTKAERVGGAYHAFVPDRLAGWDPVLAASTVAALTEAEVALRDLQRDAEAAPEVEAVARPLLRAESVASSHIEGLDLSFRRLVEAEFAPEKAGDVERYVMGNVHAMEQAISAGTRAASFSVDDLVDMHRTLFSSTRDQDIAGHVRATQNWIGGSSYTPVGAAYVPPPPDRVPELLDDLCAFISRDDVAPILQAAVAHAQFENIHPFPDGNGRVGRCVIHAILVRRGAAPIFAPPVSVRLAADPTDYVRGLTAFREGNLDAWVSTFAEATVHSTRAAQRFVTDVVELVGIWRERVGGREDSAAARLLAVLPGRPVVDSSTVAQRLGVSVQTSLTALHTLQDSGVLTPIRASRWGQAWRTDDVIDLLTDFEQRVGRRRGGAGNDDDSLAARLAALTRRRERLGRIEQLRDDAMPASQPHVDAPDVGATSAEPGPPEPGD